MFPLKQRKLIRGCQAHIDAGLGCAADYVAAVGTEVFCPFEGIIETYFGTQGGNWLRLIRTNGDKIELGHLSKYFVTSGQTKRGVLVALTGNTGSITTGPHKHIQIFRDGKRIDPENYNWEDGIIPPMPTTCEQQLAQEKEDHKESIIEKEQNYASWQSEIDRRKRVEILLKNEVDGHKQTLEQLKTSQAEVTKLEEKIKENQGKLDTIRGIVM